VKGTLNATELCAAENLAVPMGSALAERKAMLRQIEVTGNALRARFEKILFA
jgi:hypothetical protein